MRYPKRLSYAILILIHIHNHQNVPSVDIAKCMHMNPSLTRRLISSLAKAKLVTSTPGTCHHELTRPMNQISIYDVRQALFTQHIIQKQKQQLCAAAHDLLAPFYCEIWEAAKNKMKQITLEDIARALPKK